MVRDEESSEREVLLRVSISNLCILLDGTPFTYPFFGFALDCLVHGLFGFL